MDIIPVHAVSHFRLNIIFKIREQNFDSVDAEVRYRYIPTGAGECDEPDSHAKSVDNSLLDRLKKYRLERYERILVEKRLTKSTSGGKTRRRVKKVLTKKNKK